MKALITTGAVAALAAAAPAPRLDLAALERGRVLESADRYLKEQPTTLTASHSPRSAGGLHEFHSEADYLVFMTTHPYGVAERDTTNNHAACWVMQVAAFARLTGDEGLAAFCRQRFKTVLVGEHMAPDGSFPREMARTKPYGYALFNLEALATVAQILSTPADNLWTFETPDGRGLRRAVAFMVPYIRDKKTWPRPPDVMYHDEWPMRQASLLFAGLGLGKPEYVELWKTLPADSGVEEVVRNFFVRQPLLWVD
jgi:hypothetical protein